MNISLFNKKYWMRRFGEQKEVQGYLTYTRTDFVASIHVHPSGSDSTKAQPEGARRIKRLEGHGEIPLLVADETKGQKADLLYYQGDWYDCVSCQMWDHTLLSHYNYQFVLVAADSGRAIDTAEPPVTNPNAYKGG